MSRNIQSYRQRTTDKHCNNESVGHSGSISRQSDNSLHCLLFLSHQAMRRSRSLPRPSYDKSRDEYRSYDRSRDEYRSYARSREEYRSYDRSGSSRDKYRSYDKSGEQIQVTMTKKELDEFKAMKLKQLPPPPPCPPDVPVRDYRSSRRSRSISRSRRSLPRSFERKSSDRRKSLPRPFMQKTHSRSRGRSPDPDAQLPHTTSRSPVVPAPHDTQPVQRTTHHNNKMNHLLFTNKNVLNRYRYT